MQKKTSEPEKSSLFMRRKKTSEDSTPSSISLDKSLLEQLLAAAAPAPVNQTMTVTYDGKLLHRSFYLSTLSEISEELQQCRSFQSFLTSHHQIQQ